MRVLGSSHVLLSVGGHRAPAHTGPAFAILRRPAACRIKEGSRTHLRVLTPMNHDSQDQHDLSVRWCGEPITTIFRRRLCWSSAMILAVLSNHNRSPW